ncbi:synaptonemal complex central element protein 3 isoform 1-T1 [Synchiropus picturatus]
MTDSTLPLERQKTSDRVLELNQELERMVEDVENSSVRLTWMAYDLAALRTSPEMCSAMRELEEEFLRCRAAVMGDQDPDQKEDTEDGIH